MSGMVAAIVQHGRTSPGKSSFRLAWGRTGDSEPPPPGAVAVGDKTAREGGHWVVSGRPTTHASSLTPAQLAWMKQRAISRG